MCVRWNQLKPVFDQLSAPPRPGPTGHMDLDVGRQPAGLVQLGKGSAAEISCCNQLLQSAVVFSHCNQLL